MLNRHQCTGNDAHFGDVMVIDSRGMKIGLFSGCSRPQSWDPFGQRHGSRALVGARITRKRNNCPFL